MEFDFSNTSQEIFEELTGKDEEKRQISEDTVKKVSEDKAQELMDKRKKEFSDALARDKNKFTGIGSGFKKVENYSEVVEEVKREKVEDEKKKDYYSSATSATSTASRFGGRTSTTVSSAQSAQEQKSKAIEAYVSGIEDELNNISKSIKGSIKTDSALYELERKVENDRPWSAKELQRSHEMFVSTGGGRHVTKRTKEAITREKARDIRKLKKEFDRDKDLLGFVVGGLKLWTD